MVGNARARRGCHAAATPILPAELVVWEILVLLPAKAVLRCRAVCRSWRLLASAPEFLLAHHQRQPSLPRVSFHDIPRSIDPVDRAVDTFDPRRSPAERRPVVRFISYSPFSTFDFVSRDGLLLFFYSSRYYLCNPAPRQWDVVPGLVGAYAAALYRHGPSRVPDPVLEGEDEAST